MPYKNREQRLAAQKKHYEANKIRYRSNQYNRRLEKAAWFFELKKTLKCEQCGENHPACLQFHHRDPLEKEGMVSKFVGAGYSEDVIRKEIEKCEVLCANCHAKKHWQEGMEEGRIRVSLEYPQERPVNHSLAVGGYDGKPPKLPLSGSIPDEAALQATTVTGSEDCRTENANSANEGLAERSGTIPLGRYLHHLGAKTRGLRRQPERAAGILIGGAKRRDSASRSILCMSRGRYTRQQHLPIGGSGMAVGCYPWTATCGFDS